MGTVGSFNRISTLSISINNLSDNSYFQVSQLCLARRGRGGRRHTSRDAEDSLELLQAAENGRYKVVAKAEPYKNLPVNHLCMHWVSFGSNLRKERSLSENTNGFFTWHPPTKHWSVSPGCAAKTLFTSPRKKHSKLGIKLFVFSRLQPPLNTATTSTWHRVL